MECGKLTAKLRDAVPVCFIEEGKEIKRVKNIEIPDAIKELEYKGFKFDVPMSGAITFKIYFEPGTLPETWPEPRQRKTRAKKDGIATPASADAAQEAPEMVQEAANPQPEEFPAGEDGSRRRARRGRQRLALSAEHGEEMDHRRLRSRVDS